MDAQLDSDCEARHARTGARAAVADAIDATGATSMAKEPINVGNGRPIVRFESPAHGSFFAEPDVIVLDKACEGYKIDVPRVMRLQNGMYRARGPA